MSIMFPNVKMVFNMKCSTSTFAAQLLYESKPTRFPPEPTAVFLQRSKLVPVLYCVRRGKGTGIHYLSAISSIEIH